MNSQGTPPHKYMYLKVKALVIQAVQLFATSWTVACQAPLSMGFSRQEYWRRLLFPSPGDLRHPEIKAGSPAEFLTNLSHQAQILVSILPQTPLPTRLPHNIEQSSMYCTVLTGHPFNIAVCKKAIFI